MNGTIDEKPHGNSFRLWLYQQIEASSTEHLSALSKFIVAAILASVALGIAGTEPAVQDVLGTYLAFAELLIGIIFVIEFAARIWSIGIDPRYAGLVGLVRYLRRPLSIVDILVMISLLAPSLGTEMAVLRLLRILRLVALAKFGRYSQALQLLRDAISRRRYELAMSTVIAGLVFLISATGMYAIEGEVQPEAFGSIPRALWWSLTTMTTVGYGDVYPITPLGRLFAGATAIAGIGLIAMPTGILASAFTELSNTSRTRDTH